MNRTWATNAAYATLAFVMIGLCAVAGAAAGWLVASLIRRVFF